MSNCREMALQWLQNGCHLKACGLEILNIKLLLRNIQISRSYEHFKEFREICFAHIFVKFEYFVKIIIYSKSPDHVP